MDRAETIVETPFSKGRLVSRGDSLVLFGASGQYAGGAEPFVINNVAYRVRLDFTRQGDGTFAEYRGGMGSRRRTPMIRWHRADTHPDTGPDSDRA